MIKLLDNKEYKREDLLIKMQDDAFYYGDLNKLALSSSSLKSLLQSPKTYYYSKKYGTPESQPLRDVWLFHTAILEPDVFNAQTFIDVQSKNTKAFREAKTELGKVFTMKEKNDAERLADAFLKNSQAVEILKGCEFEVPAIDNVQGMPFRGKADVLGAARIVDLKTTTDIKGFSYAAKKYGYDVQCYLYCNLFNIDHKDFIFLALDKGSLDIGIFECLKTSICKGRRKLQKLLICIKSFLLTVRVLTIIV